MAITILLNGDSKEIDENVSVTGLLTGLDLDPAKIAVERNLEIVPRSQYDQTMLADGDRLEIVHFIGGGDNNG